MEKISFNLFGITLLEPMTFFTDVLIAIFCFIFYSRIKNLEIQEFDNKYYKRFFNVFGFSTLLGGFGHFFYNYFGISLHLMSWALCALSIYYIEMCSISLIKSEKIKKRLNFLIYLQLFVFIFSIMYFKEFRYVKYDISIGLIAIVFTLELISLIKSRDRGSKLMLTAIFFTFLSAIINTYKFSIHRWFNYNDLSHILIICCLYYIYAGATYKLKPEAIDVGMEGRLFE
jgi:hypothetical protein